MVDIETTCNFTGHRPDGLFGYDPRTDGNLKMLHKLRELIIHHIEHYGVDTFITGMALGVDMWAARIVLKLKETYPHLKLVAAIPCNNHSSKWNQESQEEWKMIVDRCDIVRYVSNEEYTNWCMQKRDEWMVDRSKYVIAVWNETKGGTANCVNYAKKLDKTITVLQPKTLEVKILD